MSEWRADPITGRWTVMADDLPLARRDFVVDGVARALDTPCPLCEGQELSAGREIWAARDGTPPDGPGWQVRVVPNRVPALRVEAGSEVLGDGPFRHRPGLGAHEVVVESPRHEVSWFTMTPADLARVLGAWRHRLVDLRRDTRLAAVVAFKNHGVEAGARLVHGHSQIVAMPLVPEALAVQAAAAGRHQATTGRCLWCDLVAAERAAALRVVVDAGDCVAIAPYASRTPFTLWIVPGRHGSRFDESTDADRAAVAAVLHDVLGRLGRELEHPAFNAVLHTAPADAAASGPFHWYLEIVPRVLRANGLDVGVGVSVNPVPPEKAARVLRGDR
jgi:UDPglucose--hexose-1-phosphate uridylyltransferase